MLKIKVSNEKTGCGLFRVYRGLYGDYTTQLCNYYDEPLSGALVNNQYNGK